MNLSSTACGEGRNSGLTQPMKVTSHQTKMIPRIDSDRQPAACRPARARRRFRPVWSRGPSSGRKDRPCFLTAVRIGLLGHAAASSSEKMIFRTSSRSSMNSRLALTCARRGAGQELARERQIEPMGDAARAGRHHDQLGAHEQRLFDRMGDEEHRFRASCARCSGSAPAPFPASARPARPRVHPSAGPSGRRSAPGRCRPAAACRPTACRPARFSKSAKPQQA